MQWEKKDIIDYYKRNEFGYKLWGKNMHYGYWDKKTKTLRQATKNFNSVLAQTADIKETDTVLDCGCGVGGATIFLAKTYGCRANGITICPHQIDAAYKNAKKAGVEHLVDFYEMDYLNTEFKNKSFDVVWGLESICYADCKNKFIQESHRLLKKGGRLIIADGFASKKNYRDREIAMMEKWLNGWFVNYLETPKNFKIFAKENGFKNIQYNNVTESVYLTSKIMHYASYFFIVFHILDKIFSLKSYPTDAMYHQYRALKRKLWEYGIFYAEKR